AHGDAVARARLAIDVGDDVLGAARTVDVDVAGPARGVDDRFDLLQLAVHEGEVVAVDLDDDLAADPRDGLLDTVLDRLAEVEVDAGALDLRAHLLEE